MLYALDKVSERLEKTRLGGDEGYCCALAAGDHEGIAARKILRRANLDEIKCNCCVGFFGLDVFGCCAEQVQVFLEASLEGEDADGEWRHGGVFWFRGVRRGKREAMRTEGILAMCDATTDMTNSSVVWKVVMRVLKKMRPKTGKKSDDTSCALQCL